MRDNICNKDIIIKSTDLLDREEYDGKLSLEDVELLHNEQYSFEYSIMPNDVIDVKSYKSCEIAEITVKFYQSFEIIELLTKMTAMYDVSLTYSEHTMKFNKCVPIGMRSLSDCGNVLVEVKFICKSKPGLHVEFEHIKIDG